MIQREPRRLESVAKISACSSEKSTNSAERLLNRLMQFWSALCTSHVVCITMDDKGVIEDLKKELERAEIVPSAGRHTVGARRQQREDQMLIARGGRQVRRGRSKEAAYLPLKPYLIYISPLQIINSSRSLS